MHEILVETVVGSRSDAGTIALVLYPQKNLLLGVKCKEKCKLHITLNVQ